MFPERRRRAGTPSNWAGETIGWRGVRGEQNVRSQAGLGGLVTGDASKELGPRRSEATAVAWKREGCDSCHSAAAWPNDGQWEAGGGQNGTGLGRRGDVWRD